MQYVVLGYLLEQKRTGYELKKVMEKGTGYFYDASFGSIYPTLNKLEKNGLIVRDEIMEKSKKKIYYSVTPEGKASFDTWITEPAKDFRIKYEFLAKLFFFNWEK